MEITNSANETNEEDVQGTIKLGDYIIVERHDYQKLHQLSKELSIVLGKDKVDLSEIVGKPYWTTFKTVPKVTKTKNGASKAREFTLEVTSYQESIPEAVMKQVSSGSDNRNINDDGKSQKLTAEEIVAFKESGLSAQNIVGKLVESSTTFQNKTEYAQEKYLKKKEKKYFEYLTIRRPTLRLVADILYRKDQFKIMGLRHDTLAQIVSYANVVHDGVYIVVENGTQALIAASVLQCLGPLGRIINLSKSKFAPKQAILAINSTAEQQDRVLTVRTSELAKALETDTEAAVEQEEDGPTPAKKPRWADQFDTAVSLLKNRKADGLIVAVKEFPLGAIETLLKYVKPSRSLVVFSIYREPLAALYIDLKRRKDVIGLHIFENWCREYQVMPDRTHPDVNMSSTGGHLLVATTVAQ